MRTDGSFSLGGEIYPGAAKVIEETSELNVELAKLIATRGDSNYYNNYDLRRAILTETADSMASLAVFSDLNFTEEEADFVAMRVNMKYDRLMMWHATKDG